MMGRSMDVISTGAVWFVTHMDRNITKYMIDKMNREGEWPNFSCRYAAQYISMLQRERIAAMVNPPRIKMVVWLTSLLSTKEAVSFGVNTSNSPFSFAFWMAVMKTANTGTVRAVTK